MLNLEKIPCWNRPVIRYQLSTVRKPINTGVVIVGTIGGGKLEFTLIGDTVNVAGRVEPTGLIDRGSHVLKGKSTSVRVFSLSESPTLD